MKVCNICPLKEEDRTCESCQVGNSQIPANFLGFLVEIQAA